MDINHLQDLRVVDLKKELDIRRLSKSGTKKDLIDRLKNIQEAGQNEAIKNYLQQRQQLLSQQMEQKKRYEEEEVSRSQSETEEKTSPERRGSQTSVGLDLSYGARAASRGDHHPRGRSASSSASSRSRSGHASSPEHRPTAAEIQEEETEDRSRSRSSSSDHDRRNRSPESSKVASTVHCVKEKSRSRSASPERKVERERSGSRSSSSVSVAKPDEEEQSINVDLIVQAQSEEVVQSVELMTEEESQLLVDHKMEFDMQAKEVTRSASAVEGSSEKVEFRRTSSSLGPAAAAGYKSHPKEDGKENAAPEDELHSKRNVFRPPQCPKLFPMLTCCLLFISLFANPVSSSVYPEATKVDNALRKLYAGLRDQDNMTLIDLFVDHLLVTIINNRECLLDVPFSMSTWLRNEILAWFVAGVTVFSWPVLLIIWLLEKIIQASAPRPRRPVAGNAVGPEPNAAPTAKTALVDTAADSTSTD